MAIVYRIRDTRYKVSKEMSSFHENTNIMAFSMPYTTSNLCNKDRDLIVTI